MIRHGRFYRGLVLALWWAIGTLPTRAQTVLFWRQLSTSEGSERAFAVAADVTGVYVAGFTYNYFADKCWVRKYDASGNELWNRRFGAVGDAVKSVAVDDTSIYVAGLAGDGAGGDDAFVRKYDLDGNYLWTRQFGTPGGDVAWGVAANGVAVYVVGSMGAGLGRTAHAFVRKYDSDGAEIWTREFSILASHVAVDGAGVYVAGYTKNLGSTETGAVFVGKYDADGNELWTRQVGAAMFATGVAVHATGVYVTGGTPEVGGTYDFDLLQIGDLFGQVRQRRQPVVDSRRDVSPGAPRRQR